MELPGTPAAAPAPSAVVAAAAIAAILLKQPPDLASIHFQNKHARSFLAPRWDRDRVLDVAVALFWINAALSLACTTLLPFYFFKTRRCGQMRLENQTGLPAC